MNEKNLRRIRVNRAKGMLHELQRLNQQFLEGQTQTVEFDEYDKSLSDQERSVRLWLNKVSFETNEEDILTLCCELYISCFEFLESRKKPSDIITEYLKPALDAALKLNRLQDLCLCYLGWGRMEHRLGNHSIASEMVNKANEIAQTVQLPELIGKVYLLRGQIYYALEKATQAIEQYQLALSFTSTNDLRLRAQVLDSLGRAYRSVADFEKAIDALEEAKLIYEKLQDMRGKAEVLNYLGRAYRNIGDNDSAMTYLQEASVISETVNDRTLTALARGTLADLYFDEGEFDLAKSEYATAIRIMQDEGNSRYRIGYLADRGNTLACLEDYIHARESLDLAWQLAQQSDTESTKRHVAGYMALAYLNESHFLLQRAYDVLASILTVGTERTRHFTANLYGIALLRLGYLDLSRRAFTEALSFADLALQKSPDMCVALYSRAHSLTGIAMIDKDTQALEIAYVAYQYAVSKCKLRGLRKNAERTVSEMYGHDEAFVERVLAILRDNETSKS